MKPKLVFMMLAGLMICLIFSTSQGADKFYYGSYGGIEHAYMLKDSLKFNIIERMGVDQSNIDSLADGRLRAIVHATGDSSPTDWSWKSHYTKWEAEGLDGSYYQLSYDGGTLVNDPYASGEKAMSFSGSDTGLIQRGPTYYQEPTPPGDTTLIRYTAVFRLKYLNYSPRGPMAPGPPTPLCHLIVLDAVHDAVLRDRPIYKSDFAYAGVYDTFQLANYTVPNANRIEFRIYRLNRPEPLYVDYVKVYDENGRQLLSGDLNSAIIDYVSQSWVHTITPDGDTVVYRWYFKDQPGYIDYFEPSRYIDSLLKTVSLERVGFQAFCGYTDDTLVHEYLLRQDPTDFCIDIFPIGGFGHDTTGSTYQQNWSTQIGYVNFAKTEAESLGKDFWLVPQAWTWAETLTGGPCYDTIDWGGTDWCTQQRDPSRYELRLQTFLGLCYGTEGILYFIYEWWIDNNGNLLTGLYDTLNDTTTYKWREIKEFTGPRVEKLGPILNQLTWLGACSDDSVGSFIFRSGGGSSYIDSIKSSDEPHWVEVGFFTADTGQYTDYFMLVNRECLESEAADYNVFFTGQLGLYRIRDMYSDSLIAVIEGSGGQFTVHLEPGEGKLLRLESRLFSSHIIRVPQDSSCIQCAINGAQNGDTVLVAPGTYEERINFRGKSIVVASHYILFGERDYISYTRIDAYHQPPLSDTESVVTFKSGEDSNSVLTGFTLLGGKGTMMSEKSEWGIRCGGGVFCLNSSPTICNNIIEGNQALKDSSYGYGGGIYCEDYRKTPIISSNLICSNTSNYGGGIYCSGSSAKIVNNLFIRNSALYVSKDTILDDGGYGGGIECDNRSRLIIVNNTLDSNYAYIYGGGIDVRGSSFVQVTTT
jgi:hypothetical protein